MRTLILRLAAVMAGAVAPASAQAPWNRVPPLPSSCYPADDGADAEFTTKASQVAQELKEEARQQTVANEEIAQRFTSMSPAQQQERLMAYMQKNPAGAAEAVKQMQAGFGVPTTGYPSGKIPEDFRTERKQLVEESLADWKRVAKGIPEEGTVSREAWLSRWKSVYEEWCGRWFAFGARRGTDSRFMGFLGRFKEYLTQEYIPFGEQTHAGRKKFFDTMGIPTAGFVSPVAKEAVAMYLEEAAEVLGGRSNPPISP
jgi:hypothetical protein